MIRRLTTSALSRVVQSPLPGKIASAAGRPVSRDGIKIDPQHDAIPHHVTTKFILNRYERDERELIAEALVPGMDVIELGGGIGVVSCTVGRSLSPTSDHIVVEANPDLIDVLKLHRELNDCDFEIRQRAYSTTDDVVSFAIRGSQHILGSSKHRTSPRRLDITATNVRTLADEAGFDQYMLVCDIEGSELELIDDELDELMERCRILLVEFHWPLGDISRSDVKRAQERLKSHGFSPQQSAMQGRVVSYVNTRIS